MLAHARILKQLLTALALTSESYRLLRSRAFQHGDQRAAGVVALAQMRVALVLRLPGGRGFQVDWLYDNQVCAIFKKASPVDLASRHDIGIKIVE